ncbi:MAG TPA: hypothetical protein VIZ17_00765 [Acetobacteraceae bacterium]
MAPGRAVSTSTSTEVSGLGFLGEEPSTETTYSYYPRDEEWYLQGARAGNTVLNVVLQDAS